MGDDVSESLLLTFREILSQRMGLDFPDKRLAELKRGIERFAHDFGDENVDACITRLMSEQLTRAHVEKLASYLTIGETYFLRDERFFLALEQEVFPEIIARASQTDKILRLWSAACSSGEEAYSVAILLKRMISDFSDWKITLLATDINPTVLKRAAEGVYGEWSFRGAPEWLKPLYFKKRRTGHFEIARTLRDIVTFVYHNLAQDPFPSLLNNTTGMNVILCRNALMYFAPGQRNIAISNFVDCLVEGGWLMVSPAETSVVQHRLLETVNFPGAILHRKNRIRTYQESISGPARRGFSEHSRICLPDTRIGGTPVRFPNSPNVSEVPQATDTETRNTVSHIALPLREHEKSISHGPIGHPSPNGSGDGMLNTGPFDSDSQDKVEGPVDAAARARALANQGELVEALDWCLKATGADKFSPANHYLCAAVLQEHGQVDEALKSLQKAIYLDQDFIIAHFAMGNLFLGRKNLLKAKRCFGTALRLLERLGDDQIVPESDGLTAGRLKDIVKAMLGVV